MVEPLDRPLRIAQIIECDGPGGAERLVLQLGREFQRRGHQVLTIGPAHGQGWLARQLHAQGSEWKTFSLRHMLDWQGVRDVVRLLRGRAVDAVHSHEFVASVCGAVAARIVGKPHVISMHGNRYFASRWRRRMAFRWAWRHSRAVVAVSREARDHAQRVLRLPPGSIRVIPNGIESRPGQRQPVRQELGLGPEERLIVALGNLSQRKGHIVLLRALVRLQARHPALRWHLVIAGQEQGASAELVQCAQEHGLSDRLHLLGYRADTENILAAADVFAMPSLHEGMPLAVLEAMLAGKAIVASTAGGIPEIVTDEVEGVLTPLGDSEAMANALERLLTDAALRERLAAAAQRRASLEFGIEAMADAYLELYRGCTDRAPAFAKPDGGLG